MSESLIVEYRLERDYIKKNSVDEEISGVLSIYPNKNFFKNKIETNNDLVFILDTSGSMDDKFYNTRKTKRDILIEAMENVLKVINSKDTVTIISFNSNAVIHANHLPGGAVGKIKEAIKKLRNDNGATNFEAAMKTAKIAVKNAKNINTKIIFLTDGESVTGSNKNALVIADQLAKSGITMDAMGIGGDFNFDYMRQYSELSNGLTENITDIKKARIVFTKIVKNVRKVAMKRVFLNFIFNKSLRDLAFYQISPEQRILTSKISKIGKDMGIGLNVGDLEWDSQKEFLFTANLTTNSEDSIKISEALLNYDIPDKNLDNQEEELQVYLNLSNNIKDEVFDSAVSNYKKETSLLVNYEEVKDLNQKNKPIEAIKKLEKMVAVAKKIGATDKAKTYIVFIEKLKKTNRLTQEDLNNLSYESSRGSKISMRERNSIVSENKDDSLM